jgi:uncharacterized membrane protein YphA (DoxX/SURF4 family)
MIAFSGIIQGICIFTTHPEAPLALKIVCVVSISVSFVLVLGLLTPIAGSIAALCYMIIGFELFVWTGPTRFESTLVATQLATMSLVLVLLGPGAYSLDARLFGRREIIIPDSRRPRQ